MAEHGGATVRIRTLPRPPVTVVIPRLRCEPQVQGALRAIVGACPPAAAWWDVTRRFGAAVQAELERFVADHRRADVEEASGAGMLRSVSHGALELSRFAGGVAGRMRDPVEPSPALPSISRTRVETR
jgi:hypothetical protein